MKRFSTIIALLILCSAFLHLKRYECVTPDCSNTCALDGDLCHDCYAWLAESEPITREVMDALFPVVA